jgi:hypothetical protein
MTLLLIARYAFLAGLLTLVSCYVWLTLTGRE